MRYGHFSIQKVPVQITIRLAFSINMEQIIIAMDGACRFILDDGHKKEQVLLNRPDVGLYIGKNMWREMHDFSYGCKLVVLASEYYDENEYIRNYDEFLKSLPDNNDSQTF